MDVATVLRIPRRGEQPPMVLIGEYADEGEPDVVIEVYGVDEEAVARRIAAVLEASADA